MIENHPDPLNELPRRKRRDIKMSVCYLFYRSKLRGIKPYRFRIVLQMIRVIRVICEICGLKLKS